MAKKIKIGEQEVVVPLKQEIQSQVDNSIDTHNDSEASHQDIRTLISSLNENKLNKNFTSLIEEVSLTLSDLFVIDKGSGARKVSLGTIASYLSTQELQLFTIVEELPMENQNPNTIYLLVTENEEGQNQLLEYIWIVSESRWELIGSVGVDLSDYYTKTEVNGLLGDKVDKVAGKGLSTNDYTNVDKNKVDLIETDGDGTKYFGDDGQYHDNPTIDELLGNLTTLGFVKRSGTNTYIIDTSTYQPLDADLTSIAGLSGTSGFLKKTASNTWSLDTSVYLTSITKAMVETVLTGTITTHTHNASAIVEDTTHRFVTDAEKSTWNGKQNALTAGDGISISGNVISADSGLNVETWNTATKFLTLSDANKLFVCNYTNNQALTIPENATVAFPIGTMITFSLITTYKVTFFAENGVTLTSMDNLVVLATQYGMASLIKTDTNTWQLVGALE